MTNILIVDDEDAVRGLLTKTLTGAGYKVFAASDGKQALDIFHKQDIDLVITDLIMPNIEGIEVIREIRSYKQRTVKIIAISGGGVVDAEEYLKTARRLGADHVLGKPFTIDDLLEAVHQVITAT